MKEKEENAFKWLMNVDPYHWCTHAFSPRPKCDKLLNNISESFNSTIQDYREKPILQKVKKESCRLTAKDAFGKYMHLS